MLAEITRACQLYAQHKEKTVPDFPSRNLTEAVDGVADAIRGLASAVHRLGTADAATHMGALEFHALAVKEVGERVGGALEGIADALDRQPG